MFRISAKRGISDNEIRGPTVFKKDKDVEYTIFLPFDVIAAEPDVNRGALTFLMKGVYRVLESLEIDTATLRSHENSIVNHILTGPGMLR
jgi:hypothetical protein